MLKKPPLVEAIEDLFVPLAIYNNKRGHDEEVLAIYNEPVWNNPVLYVVDTEGKSIINRLSGKYTLYNVVQYIKKALIAWKEPIPPYLSLLEEELEAMRFGTKETYLSMFCFWSGEKHIGQIPGVVETEAGFMDGKQVSSISGQGGKSYIDLKAFKRYDIGVEFVDYGNSIKNRFPKRVDSQLTNKSILSWLMSIPQKEIRQIFKDS